MDAGFFESKQHCSWDITYHFYTCNQIKSEFVGTCHCSLDYELEPFPPSSAQKVHTAPAESINTTLTPPPATPARTVTPAGHASSDQSSQIQM